MRPIKHSFQSVFGVERQIDIEISQGAALLLLTCRLSAQNPTLVSVDKRKRKTFNSVFTTCAADGLSLPVDNHLIGK
jgi:hypothetical protein